MTHDELRALCAQATAGPWSVLHHGRRTHANVIRAGGDAGLFIDVGSGLKAEYTDPDQCKADARFIAAAREAVPALLDENARLRAALEGLVDAVATERAAHGRYFAREDNALAWEAYEDAVATTVIRENAARAALGGEALDAE
jgi:hypothetical protein